MLPSLHTNQRFLAYVNDGKATLVDATGRRAWYELIENGPTVDPAGQMSYLGIPASDGLWVWEGTLKVVVLRVVGEEDDYIIDGMGGWRRPNERELAATAHGIWNSLYPFVREPPEEGM